MMKNYEGHTDTTAGKAIRRAHRARRRGRTSTDRTTFTYRIGELPGFPVTLK